MDEPEMRIERIPLSPEMQAAIEAEYRQQQEAVREIAAREGVSEEVVQEYADRLNEAAERALLFGEQSAPILPPWL